MSIDSQIIKSKISVEECRKILCKNGGSYTQEEILQIRDYLYQLALIDMEIYFTKKRKEGIKTPNKQTRKKNNADENSGLQKAA